MKEVDGSRPTWGVAGVCRNYILIRGVIKTYNSPLCYFFCFFGWGGGGGGVLGLGLHF